MADSVKGRSYDDYPTGIRRGILLHRFIDDYTDNHPVCLETKMILRPRYSKLSPILSDMIYDHLLAVHWENHSEVPLRTFVNDVYSTLQARIAVLTPRAQSILPYMVKYDWLYNYQFEEGMKNVLHGMSRRVREGAVLAGAWEDIQANRQIFEEQFAIFFADLKESSAQRRGELMGV